ncbi:arsenate reductase/protein-tyrosine-phosphatase family protein [Nesterenkonia aerolata]|uniref:Low molecular weight phosphatase family protein n=1 Tax=Nesterenkonia aerolata TaxID=3074079 RepID=A0ABU2DU52_9MICC|nr:low molecular weight phosphatase family protein [Nesterenkonia sp. LY-0111]MDR8019901.1 low molecular weight phosphatase family protein [Nesterenkonia sp. LY-0111]
MADQFTILTICTGNICRSPAMERLLAHRLAAAGNIRVRGAGVFAHDGEEMKEPMRRRVADYGADAEGTAGRQVDAALIDEADLILTATREHRRELLRHAPDAGHRIFTLREAARLMRTLTPGTLEAADAGQLATDRLAALVPLLDEARVSGVSGGSDDDILDPYMMGEDAYDESFAQLRAPIEELTAVIGV